MLIVDSQVHIWAADSPERPWPARHKPHRPEPITAEDEGDSRVKIADQVPLKIDGAAAHIFDAGGVGYHAADA